MSEPTSQRKPLWSFTPATLRGVTRVNEESERLGISVNIEDGEPIRFTLDVTHALKLVSAVSEVLAAFQTTRSQSDLSPAATRSLAELEQADDRALLGELWSACAGFKALIDQHPLGAIRHLPTGEVYQQTESYDIAVAVMNIVERRLFERVLYLPLRPQQATETGRISEPSESG